MWLALGAGAVMSAILNLVWAFNSKDASWFRFASISLTALTVCAFYNDAAQRVLREDWGGLMDILPAMSKALWGCVIVSILVNSISLLIKQRKK